MKKQLLLSTVLTAALAAGAAHAAGSGYGSQSTDARMDRTQGMEQTQEQTDRMGASPGQSAGTQGQAASGEQGYDPSRVGVGGVAADQTAQITNNTDAVTQIQQALQEEGHDIQVDGIWGPNTEQALRDFQQQQGQMQATGQPNEETLQALDVELGQMQPQTAETPSDVPMGSGMGSGMQDRMESSPGMGSGGMGSSPGMETQPSR